MRIAAEPNTVISEAPYDSAILYGTNIYVLENYPFDAGYTYYNYDFDLLIDPVLDQACTGCTLFQIDGYVPTQGDYPAAFQNLPIDGYMSSAWFDPAHAGEGVLTRNLRQRRRYLAHDLRGLVHLRPERHSVLARRAGRAADRRQQRRQRAGATTTRAAVSPAISAASTDSHVWGTMSFSFPDCGHMTFTFNGQTDATTNGPSGSGTRTWVRLADINGLWCE